MLPGSRDRRHLWPPVWVRCLGRLLACRGSAGAPARASAELPRFSSSGLCHCLPVGRVTLCTPPRPGGAGGGSTTYPPHPTPRALGAGQDHLLVLSAPTRSLSPPQLPGSHCGERGPGPLEAVCTAGGVGEGPHRSSLGAFMVGVVSESFQPPHCDPEGGASQTWQCSAECCRPWGGRSGFL